MLPQQAREDAKSLAYWRYRYASANEPKILSSKSFMEDPTGETAEK